jgi:uncharacterized membrane protein
MAKDLGDAIGTVIGRAAREAAHAVQNNARKASNGPLSGGKGLAAGAGLAALPLAAKGASALVRRGMGNGAAPVKKARDAVGKTIDQATNPATMAKKAGKSMMPDFGGDSSSGTDGVGKGRRMPIQQAIDVAVPIDVAYNQWTQFEEWPSFMHRLERVTQEDDSHVSFKTKIWGISKEFKAEIVEQRPDDRIKWRVTEGVSHTGVVTFHELSDRLTRVDVDLDVHPGSLIEKAGRGMRHVKRAVRADLSRFKAHVELEDPDDGAWRGEIDDGKVKSKRRSSRSSSSKSKSSSGSRSKPASGSGSRSKSSSSGSRSKSASGSGSRSKSSSNRSASSGRSSSSRSSSPSGSGSGSSRSSSSSGSGSGSSRSSSNGRRSSSRSSNGSSGSRKKATASS